MQIWQVELYLGCVFLVRLCVCVSSEIWAMCLKKSIVGYHLWTRAAGCLLNLWTMHAVGYPHECLVSFPPKSLRLYVNPFQHGSPRFNPPIMGTVYIFFGYAWNSFNPNMLRNPHISKWQPQ